jgi:hypothetical protein
MFRSIWTIFNKVMLIKCAFVGQKTLISHEKFEMLQSCICDRYEHDFGCIICICNIIRTITYSDLVNTNILFLVVAYDKII